MKATTMMRAVRNADRMEQNSDRFRRVGPVPQAGDVV
jgi:hypothetical protein